MTSRDWPSDKAAAFQAVTGGFDSRVPLQIDWTRFAAENFGIKLAPTPHEPPLRIEELDWAELP